MASSNHLNFHSLHSGGCFSKIASLFDTQSLRNPTHLNYLRFRIDLVVLKSWLFFGPPEKNHIPLSPPLSNREWFFLQKNSSPFRAGYFSPHITSSNRLQFTLRRQYAFQSLRSYLSNLSFNRFWVPVHPPAFKPSAEHEVYILFYATATYYQDLPSPDPLP